LLDVRYLLVALAGGLIGLLARLPTGSPLGKLLLVVDAAALGLFAVAGATRALDAGLSFLPALLLGITTAVVALPWVSRPLPVRSCVTATRYVPDSL
jgi:uncharacterized membrane protein YeiH